MLETYRKLFNLPTPTQLNMSDDDDAMGMKDFLSPGQYSWEDYYSKLKELHPIKYFFAHTIPDFKDKVWIYVSRPFDNGYYWLVSHIIPSRRYHILNLSQPNNEYETYKWGYIDPDRRMLYAMMNILNSYMDKEHSNNYLPSEEDIIKEPWLAEQRKSYLEIQVIHNYWNVQRKLDLKEEDNIQTQWWNARQANDPNKEKYWEALKVKTEYNDAKLEEMLHRLIDIRKCMWS